MSVRDFLKSKLYKFKEDEPINNMSVTDFENLILEFSKSKVEEALKIAADKAKIDLIPIEGYSWADKETDTSFEGDVGRGCDYHPVRYEVNKDSIINSFSLENIK